jgi:hypothetical protein
MAEDKSMAFLMRHISAVVLVAGLLLFTADLAAGSATSPASLLDRPIDEIKKEIAAAAHCTWGPGVGMNIIGIPNRQTCSGPFKENWYSVQMETTVEGKVDSVSFLPKLANLFGYNDRPPDLRELKREKEATAETIAKLFPKWTEARAWVNKALTQAIEKDFQASIRIDNTSIYVTEFQYVNLDHPFALLVLTKKTDLTEYKKYPCADDEQGPAEDSPGCSPRRVGPRPPDNPILHPK